MKKLFDHTKKTAVKDIWESEYDWEHADEKALESEMTNDIESKFPAYYGSEKELEEYADPEEQYLEAEEQYLEPEEQYLDPEGQYIEAEEQYIEAEEQYLEPEEQYLEPEGQYIEAEEQYLEPEEQYLEPEGQYIEAEEQYIETEEQYPEPEGQYIRLEESEEYVAEEIRFYEAGEEFEGYGQQYQEEAEQYMDRAESEEYVAEDVQLYESGDEAEVYGEQYIVSAEQYTGQEESGEYAAEEIRIYESEEGFEEYEPQYAGSEEQYIESEEPEIRLEETEEYVEEDQVYELREESDDEYIEQDKSAHRKAAGGINGAIRKKEKQGHEEKSSGMELMDKVLLAVGAGILVLLCVAIGVFAKSRMMQSQVAAFANVGLQLEGINVIGEYGLQAVAAAEKAKLTLAAATPTEGPADPKKDYNEIDYSRQISVEPDFTSIQKDLKIKFINQKSDKLVPNVPFSVTVVDPDGKSYIWSDDDMDGIIYKKDITPGMYQVTMETLTDARYVDYVVATSVKSVEVKKEIVYEKVDVANEVKKETEVNAAKEDTKKTETVVESVLQDTVAWVESKVIAATYNEVAKSTIPDPATFVRNGNNTGAGHIELAAQTQAEAVQSGKRGAVEQASVEIFTVAEIENPVQAPTETENSATMPTENVTTVPTEVPTPVPTEDPTPIPTEAPAPIPTEAATPVPTEVPTPAPVVTPVPAKGTIAVNETTISGSTGAHMTAKAVAAGFAEDRKVVYSIRTDNSNVATATVDGSGNIDVYGVAVGTTVLTVTANYENGTAETEASVNINVTIGGIMALTLDVTSLTTFVQTSAIINGNITNVFSADPTLTAETSDSNIAVVSVDKKAVTVTGVAEGTAVITVKYAENGSEVSAACTVTVKTNPKQDRTTLLKDEAGRQLYVADGNTYKEATYADYYIADKFFVRGEARYTGWQTIDGKVYYFTADGNKVTGEQVIQGAKYNFASDGSLMASDGTLGIDVSKWNGNIDWNAVKNSGISYVIIRSGYRGSSAGKLIEDPKFVSNINGATAAGLKVGIYFFTQAVNEIEAVEEASMVLDQIKGYTISYPIFLDVEASGGRGDNIDKATRTAVCRAFCQTIQSAGYTAGVYSNKTWFESKMDAGSLNAYKIWLAQYAVTPTYTGRYDIWQYKPTGSISGISGNVDMNISYLGY